MSNDWFFEKFALIADAPGAVARMRELVLDLAMKGKVTDRNQNSEYVDANYINEPYSELLPSNWRLLNFGKFCDIQGGSQPPKEQFIDKPRSDYVQMFQIRDLGEKPVPVYIPRDSTTRFCSEGDILIGRYGASVGKIFWAQNGTYNVALAKFIFPKDAFVPAFAFWLLKSDFFQAKLAGASRSAQAGFNKGDLAGITFPLPPLAEQKRIVAKVDELMGLCDALESQQQERDLRKSVLVRSSLSRFAEAPTPENLGYLFHKSYDIPPAELRKSILTLAVQGKLVPQDPNDEPADSSPGIDAFFEIPASWRWKALGVLGLCRTGKTPPTSEPRNFGTGFPFIGPGQITRNGHITGSEKTITNKGLENSTEAKDYDILMVCIGGSIGKAAISREVLGFNQQINSLRVERDLPKFIYFAVTSDYFQEQVLANASGSATPIINKGKWERIPVPVPPLAEQHRIVAKVDQLMALVDELERQQDASLENASKLLDAIVQEMTSGGQGITATLES
jgi:type I restriction enzyme S subunit